MARQRTAGRGGCAVHRAVAVAVAAVMALCWGGGGGAVVSAQQLTADGAPMELIVPLDTFGEWWARGFTGTRCLQYHLASLSANRTFTALFQVGMNTLSSSSPDAGIDCLWMRQGASPVVQ